MKITRDSWLYAQQCVLGSCLIDQRAIAYILFTLKESDFIDDYKPMFRAMVDLYTAGKPVDPVVILNIVGAEYRETILQLMEITPTASNISRYAEITAEQAKVLHMRELGLQLAEADSIEEAQELMDGANGMMVTGGMQSFGLKNLLRKFFDSYNHPPEYCDWFIPALRRIIRLKKGNYMIIGARPSVGKSAFSMQAAVYWAVVLCLRVGFYSAEMGEDDLTDRLVASCVGVKLEDIQERRLSDKEIAAVAEVSSRISEAPLYVIPASGHTVSDIKADAMQKHLDIVIIDYLQIVAGRGDTEYDRVTKVSHEIQAMCKNTGITVLALSQLSRIRGAKPTLEDLRSSGQLEQDADIVAFLHRPGAAADEVEFIIAKNRNGKLGTTKLAFDGGLQQFLYVGKGDKTLKPYDYSSCRYQAAPQQLPQLSMDTYVPFEDDKGRENHENDSDT